MIWLWLILVFCVGFVSGFYVMYYAVGNYIEKKLIPELEESLASNRRKHASGR